MTRARRRVGGLDRFGDRLNPAVADEVASWRRHPELARLVASLEAHTAETAFFDVYAEALLARHLLHHDCGLRFEVPAPTGRHCDFEVRHGDRLMYLHVKRVHSEREPPSRLTISPRLRYLERIRRPYIVQVRWSEGLGDRQMRRFVERAAQFIQHARVGDELTIRDEPRGDGRAGRELGGVRIVAPWKGSHVSLAIGLPGGFIDESPRIRKLLERAYQQFMPRALNVIVICSMAAQDVEDFQSALLGSHVERWDAVPPPGQRIAHGRAADGFWHGGRFAESVIAGWFDFAADEDELSFRLWHRRGFVLDAGMQAWVEEILGGADRWNDTTMDDAGRC